VKLTFIWQSSSYEERDWIRELLGSIAVDHLVDGKHQVVMDDSLLIDSYLFRQPREYYESFRGKNAWLLHMSDETYEGGYEYYDCFRGVFRIYWSSFFNPRRVMQIPLGYTAGITPAPILPPQAERPYVWSFIGATGKSSRPEMTKALSPLVPNFLHTTDVPNAVNIAKPEYQEILRNSAFAPSAMGNVNLECYRPYEALECRSIPILERRVGFDYFKHLLGEHPMPTFLTWNEAARFIENIRKNPTEQEALLTRCVEWWAGYKGSLKTQIQQFLEQPHGAELGPMVSPLRSIPGMQAFELLRHHSMPAFVRRVNRQVSRIVKEGQLRKTGRS